MAEVIAVNLLQKRRDVVALYVDPAGPYPGPVEQWYDETRDARTYAGPLPVVAHPPCGPWGNFSHMCTKQDPSAALTAVEHVRRWGGILEHPVGSRLFRTLPRPGELPDAWGGRSYRVEQVHWGHGCVKPTILYVVGINPKTVLQGVRFGRRPTHRTAAERRRRTPIAFAEWLLALAAQARRT